MHTGLKKTKLRDKRGKKKKQFVSFKSEITEGVCPQASPDTHSRHSIRKSELNNGGINLTNCIFEYVLNMLSAQ